MDQTEAIITFEQLILGLQERRCVLENERIHAVEHLNCIRGGIAELDFLIANLQAAQAEPEGAPESAESAPASE